jgi:heptose-I-phosphate ethanolaminephosphotransferase
MLLTTVMMIFLGRPMYRLWLSANFYTYILSAGEKALHLTAESALLLGLWSLFIGCGGAACAALYGFFLILEFAPAVICHAAGGPWEFACLCIFPAFWTLTAWSVHKRRRGLARFWRWCLILLTTAGVTQYMVYLCYLLRFGRRLGANTLMTILGTNIIEARSFMTDQFGLLPAVAGFAAGAVIWLFLRTAVRRCRTADTAVLVVSAAVCLALGIYCRGHAPAYSNLFFDFEKGYRQYQTALESLKEARADPSRRISDLNVSKQGHGEICVIIIGESASPRHMQRWGYPRPTTPWLCSKDQETQDSLIVLDRAYSCMVHTEPAVTMALSQFSNYDPSLLLHNSAGDSTAIYTSIMKSFSLLEILGGAGVKTYWFSNQEKIGAYNNLISAQSRSALKQEFLEDFPLYGAKNGHQDGELLQLLSNVIASADPNDNYVVFLHFRGSHWSYKSSAPEAWPWLPEVKHRKNAKPEVNDRIDAYDRSISYTDAQLRRISEMLKESRFPVSSMLYFSDHGEDVTGVGHNFDAFKPVMAEIPVVLWLSQGYRVRYPETARQLRTNAGRIFTSDLIFELALGLNHVNCANVVPERQLTSPRYGVNAANARFWRGKLLRSVIPGLKD